MLVQKACEIGSKYTRLESEKNQLQLDYDALKKTLEDKDKVLAELKERYEADEKKLANFGKLVDENAKLKKERLDRGKNLDSMNFSPDFEKETFEVEPHLDPIKTPVPDVMAVYMFRLHSRLLKVQGYIARLRAAVGRIYKELWLEDTFQVDLEAVVSRVGQIPDRVQAWKKSTARCGADVTLSFVRVHCKEAREDKLKALQVANTKKLQFENFMETFISAATHIADGIDLDTFLDPTSHGEP
ncbi:hypothetical protein ZWY2020_021799 [Hordeum vulgare]|nr:hypothetical protein ZWY2020_021799 [Hordeum vulgare]